MGGFDKNLFTQFFLIIYLIFSPIIIGAHMRRASAELAERRRASFGSRGEIRLIDNRC